MRKKSVVLKYLLSYFAVLLIPFAFSYYFITNHVFDTLKEELESSNTYSLEQIRFGLDSSIEQMESIVTQFALNDEIDLGVKLHNVNATMLMMDELARYLYISDFLYEIGIYTEHDIYFYTSKSSSRIENFLGDLLEYDKVTSDEVYQYLSTPQRFIIPSQTVDFYGIKKEITTFIIPVNIINQYDQANLMFLFETKYLDGLMNSEEVDTDYFLMSQTGSVIYKSNVQGIEFDIAKIYEYAIEQGIESFAYEGQLVTLQQTENMDMVLISLTPLDTVYQTVNKLGRELFLVMLAVFLIGCIVIYVAMQINYKPIVRIREQILGYVPEQETEGNEITMIQNSLDYLVNKNELLFKDTEQSSRVYLLRRLLKGNIVETEEFNTLAKPYAMSYDKEHFVVMILLFKFEETSKENIDIADLEKVVNKYVHGYMYADVQGKCIFVGNLSKIEIDLLQETVYALSEELHAIYNGADICIGIGGVYREPLEIANSYAEAIVATDYRFIKGKKSVIFQHELLTEKNITYPYYLLEKFQLAFKNQNLKTTQVTIDEITNYIKETNCPMHHARSICYDMMSVLSNALNDMGEKELTAKISGRYNFMLADFTTIDEMMEISKNICMNVQAYVREDVKSKAEVLIDDIKLEIQDTCFDVNFSIEALAGQFSMTFSNISSIFKSKTGQTIIDYVTELRMAKAKDLLLHSDKSVGTITEEIGYVNPSSFIRKFKGLYGVTPKQFAAQGGESKSE